MDSTSSFLARLNPRNPSFVIISSILSTLTVIAIAKFSFEPPTKKVIESPRKNVLSNLSKDEQADLPYPPDIFPGARDIPSPYGSIRIYEFGPMEGRKVLLLHGITTPCIALGNLANALVEKGCRVMLMDLFGRGYSDSPDLPHDGRLYCTQILLAITSSPLAWTPAGFSLIGYSMGGGIAVDFATHFPKLVNDLVLLAPSGLIRSHHFGWQSNLVYASFVPDWLVHAVVGRRLKGASSVQGNTSHSSTSEEADKVVGAEVKGNRDPQFESAVLSKTRPGMTVASAVTWQIQNHTKGFVRSFVSSIRFAPIKGQQDTWRKLRERDRRVLIIAGSKDSIIVAEELREDALDAIGEDGLEWRIVEGGHEFPITNSEEIASIILQVWGDPVLSSR